MTKRPNVSMLFYSSLICIVTFPEQARARPRSRRGNRSCQPKRRRLPLPHSFSCEAIRRIFGPASDRCHVQVQRNRQRSIWICVPQIHSTGRTPSRAAESHPAKARSSLFIVNACVLAWRFCVSQQLQQPVGRRQRSHWDTFLPHTAGRVCLGADWSRRQAARRRQCCL
jgi:hypothetical protein